MPPFKLRWEEVFRCMPHSLQCEGVHMVEGLSEGDDTNSHLESAAKDPAQAELGRGTLENSHVIQNSRCIHLSAKFL